MCAHFHRSDLVNDNIEHHYEDYCSSSDDFLLNDQGSDYPFHWVCETEVSRRCPFGWAFYLDDGSEGEDSCVQLSTFSVASYDEAAALCPAGSHLLTVSGNSDDSMLLKYASSLYEGGSFFVGCQQAPNSQEPFQDWGWVDGTSAANLNCGEPGCGLWPAQSES